MSVEGKFLSKEINDLVWKMCIRDRVHSVTEDTKIEDLLPLITKTNSPIYVVNEERELKGLVPLSSICLLYTSRCV